MAVLISMLLALMLFGLAFVSLAGANPDLSNLVFAMPEEYINYTVVCINGTLWAKIDGVYPIYVLTLSDDVHCALQALPMLYPIPPGTTNIHVAVDDVPFEWSYYDYGTHHTALGDWSMIRCVLAPVPDNFVLKIHYEHPIQVIKESYVFLYDLNIREYLSPLNPNSTAYFTIRFEANVSDVKAFTTATDNVWSPIEYEVSQENSAKILRLHIFSEYSKPLLGDLAVTFSLLDSETTSTPSWILIPTLLIVVLISILSYGRLKQR
ncbi:MAG: hypothetical protein NWF09_08565 [Candidatus Bathyarchaeota archaeon]|nr:hypothetical protein [Candidatus Bathyarchaeota archaeon]